LSEVASEKIADKARKAPVSVWKRRNGDKAVTETNRDFVGWIGSMVHPESRIVDGLLHFHDDPIGLNADVAFGRAILPLVDPKPVSQTKQN
jgi:hypothetical protein